MDELWRSGMTNVVLLAILVIITIPLIPFVIRKKVLLKLGLTCFLIGIFVLFAESCSSRPVWRSVAGEGPPVIDSETQIIIAPVGQWTDKIRPDSGRKFRIWPKESVRYRVNGRHIVNSDSRGKGRLGTVYSLEIQSREKYPVEVVFKYTDETP